MTACSRRRTLSVLHACLQDSAGIMGRYPLNLRHQRASEPLQTAAIRVIYAKSAAFVHILDRVRSLEVQKRNLHSPRKAPAVARAWAEMGPG